MSGQLLKWYFYPDFQATSMQPPAPDEYPAYYHSYISRVTTEVFEALSAQLREVPDFFEALPEDVLHYRYAPGKWTIKEILGHLIDTERIMAYRVLRFSRMDVTALPGFDENEYVAQARFNERTIGALCAEFRTMRASHLYHFAIFNDRELNARGVASGHAVSVRALLYIIAGHALHHVHIIRERYLQR